MKRNVLNPVSIALAVVLVLLGCGDKAQQKAKHLERANRFIAEKKFDEAVLELKNVVQIDPDDDEAQYELGEVHMKLRQKGAAAQAYENAIAANPENLKAQLRMGQIFLERKEILNARKTVKLLLDKSPEDIEALNLLAGIQIQEKNTEAAVQTLHKAVSIDNGHKNTHLLLAGLLLMQGKADEAEKAYRRVLAIDPSEPVAYLELIRLSADRGQWENVPALLDRLIDISKNRYDYLAKLGTFFETHRKWEMAEKVYQRAVASADVQDPAPLMNLGTYYARRQLNDKALETMQLALEKNPEDATILAFIAKTHFDMDHPQKAREAADRALQKDPQHEVANYIRGRVYFLDKDYASAIERFDQAIKAAPGNALAYYFKALSLLAGTDEGRTSESDLLKVAAGFADDNEAWDLELAITNLEKVLELNPGMLHAKLLLAELNLKRRDEKAARKHIEAALAQAPGNEKALVLLTGLKVLERDYNGAIDLCNQVIEKNPTRSEWHIRLGMVYQLSHRPQEALQTLEKARTAAPGDIQPIRLMVQIYLGQKRFEEALVLCDSHAETVSDAPDRLAEIEYLKGTIFLTKGDEPTAISHLQKAIAKNPKALAPHFTLARLYFQKNEPARAIVHYQNVLDMDENNVEAIMALGDLHYFQKENEKAEAYYRRAVVIKPGYGPAANNLAFILANDAGKLDEAYRFAQQAVRKMPLDANARDTMGWIFHQQGNYSKAITEFEQSLSLNPKNALTHYHIGLTYYKKGEFEKSRTHIQEALAIDPDFMGAEEARVLLDE